MPLHQIHRSLALLHSGRAVEEGGQAGSTEAGHHGRAVQCASAVRSWALSPARSLEEERRSLEAEGPSLEADRDALLNGVEPESDVEQESDVALDGSERCFLANANEMEEVELSSCTPSSQLNELDRSLVGTTDVEESASRGTEERAPRAPKMRNKTAKVAAPGPHLPAHGPASECEATLDRKQEDPLEVHPKAHLDPISEFDRAVSARGHRRVRRHRLQESRSPWPPTPTVPSERGQRAGEESSSQVTDFATTMGACDAFGWWVHVMPPRMRPCHAPTSMSCVLVMSCVHVLRSPRLALARSLWRTFVAHLCGRRVLAASWSTSVCLVRRGFGLVLWRTCFARRLRCATQCVCLLRLLLLLLLRPPSLSCPLHIKCSHNNALSCFRARCRFPAIPKLRLNRTWSVPVDYMDQLFPVCLALFLSCVSLLMLFPVCPSSSCLSHPARALTSCVVGVEHRRLRFAQMHSKRPAIAVPTRVTPTVTATV